VTTENNQQQPRQYGQAEWPTQPQYAPTTYGFPPQQQPPRRVKGKSRKRWILPVVCLVGGIILGSAGAASSRPSVSEAAPAPTPTVTATATVTAEPIIKEVTPQACIDALDIAAEAIGLFSTYPGMASEAVQAAGTFDTEGLNTVTEKLQTFNGKLDKLTPKIGPPTRECRALAK
jgi:hypothetical protein